MALDLATHEAALSIAENRGLDAPFSLFLNADTATLDGSLPERPATGPQQDQSAFRALARCRVRQDKAAEEGCSGAEKTSSGLGRSGHAAILAAGPKPAGVA